MRGPDWKKLLTPLGEIDVPRVLGFWAWLLNGPVKPLALTRFCDWFLEVPGGEVFRLDVLEGTFQQVSASVDEFRKRSGDDDALVDWFQDGMVYALYDANTVPGSAQGFGYRVPPIIGGSMDRPNVIVVEVGGWQLFMAKLHQQVQKLPAGTRVKHVEMDAHGNLKLHTTET